MEHLWMCTTRIFYSSIAIWKKYLVATGIKPNFSHDSLWYQFCCIIRCLTLKAAWFSPTRRDCGSFFVLIVSWCSVRHSASAVIALHSCIELCQRAFLAEPFDSCLKNNLWVLILFLFLCHGIFIQATSLLSAPHQFPVYIYHLLP